MPMTKSKIIDYVCDNTDMTKKECASAVESVFQIIKSQLESGDDVNIARFGKWSVKHKRERKGRDPKTGEPMTIRSRDVIRFHASPVLKKIVNMD